MQWVRPPGRLKSRHTEATLQRRIEISYSRLYSLERREVKQLSRLRKEKMARSKEFDEERVLAAAMDVFWRRGYENASLEALLGEMGIAKQSLYDTFGDKRALYLKAMALYRKRTNSALRALLA